MAVDLEPQLLEILACPCPRHAPLRSGFGDDAEADYLTCTACGRGFPVRDGVPVLLLDEAIGGTGEADADGPAPDEPTSDEAG